jgi:hypothetical protein
MRLDPVSAHDGVQEFEACRRSWDDDIVEELEAEAKDAEQRAAAAMTMDRLDPSYRT